MSLAIISSQNLSPGIRGALTKWMLEIGPGTFVGMLPERVTQELWKSVDEWCECADLDENAHAILVRAAPTEQGFTFATTGKGRYLPAEYAGLWLVERAAGTETPDDAYDKTPRGNSEAAESSPNAAVPW